MSAGLRDQDLEAAAGQALKTALAAVAVARGKCEAADYVHDTVLDPLDAMVAELQHLVLVTEGKA